MFTFETGIAYLAGNLSGFLMLLIIGGIFLKRKNKAVNKAIAAHSKATYMQMSGRAVRPNVERNVLGDLRRANPERCKAFGHEVKDMDVTFWATELAGEAGELCNWVKKMVRGDDIPNIKAEIAKEAADVVVSLDLLCIHQDIDLQGAIVRKFNETSDRVKSPIKL